MSDQNQLAIQPKASDQLALFLGIEKGMMIETLKAQCFKGKHPDEVSDTQLAAFISTANILQVNPLVPGMLYAYPEKNGGITPILGPDGVFKKLDEFISSGKLAGYECDVECEATGKPIKANATIYRKGDEKPAKYTAWFSEWCVTSNPNWNSRPKHMIWTRAIKQCARQVIHGLPMDADEYAISQMTNVTETATDMPTTPAAERPKPPARRGGAAAAKAEAGAGAVVEPTKPAEAPAHFTGPTVDAEIVNTPEAPPAAAQPTQKAEPTPAKVETPAPAKEPVKTPAPDLAKVPEVVPGVNVTGFLGHVWPCLVTATVNSIVSHNKTKAYHQLNVTTHNPGEATFDVISFEHIKLEGILAVSTQQWLKAGAVIEFNAKANLRPSKVKGEDGKPLPDLTKPPAIIASNVTEAEGENF